MTIFTTTACPHCKIIKNYCKDKGIAFTEKNTDTDEDAFADIVGEGFQSVPVVKYKGKYKLVHSVDEFKSFIGM